MTSSTTGGGTRLGKPGTSPKTGNAALQARELQLEME